MRRLASALLLLLGGVLILIAVAPAGAQTCDDPELTTEDNAVRAGDTVTVTGTGFDPACATGTGPHSANVTLTLVQGDATEELATVRATDDDVSFEADLDIPDDANPGSATITAQGAAGNATLSVQITVGTQVEPDNGDTADDLAETGLEVTVLVGMAFALLLVGISLEWVAQVLPARL